VAFPEKSTVEALKALWTNRLVAVKPGVPALARFAGKVGRVVTVNFNGKALVDFADGGWYDVADFERVLDEVTAEADKLKYDPTVNSAQKHPTRQS
jgi:hypothetical protein